ncbi:unnamed protein product [Somion occarium]|uniref:RTA1-like protein n=1 Tax=Somion occarium TaxID=3059160 RepID=A0ABP1DZY0_9APHY
MIPAFLGGRYKHVEVLSIILFALALAPSGFAAPETDSPPRPADPYADPANDPYNPLRYIPSNVLTALALVLYLLIALTQMFMMWKIGGKYMTTLVIAECAFCIGFGFRFALHSNPESKGIYIAEYLFIILSPCGFIAADYVLLGRLSRWLNCDSHLLITPRRITLVFVLSDVVTFLVQAAGGAISISNNVDTAKFGSHLALAGLALQLASFVFFTLVFTLFVFRVYKHEHRIWTRDSGKPIHQDWRILACALLISCVGILVRSTYRTIELSQGYLGSLSTTEGFFYGLDTLPLFVAVVVYVPFWPGRFIADDGEMKRLESVESNTKYMNMVPLNP